MPRTPPPPGLRPGLEPQREEIEAMMASATSFVTDFLGSRGQAPAVQLEGPEGELTRLLAPPGDGPGEFGQLLATFRAAAERAVETAGPGCFAYFTGGGLFASALSELLASTVNRFTGVSSMAPALAAMEHGVIRWFCEQFGLPESTSGGLITTGSSTGTLSALIAARQELLGDPPCSGTIYVTEHTHLCVAKAARIAGFAPDQVRTVPVTADLRMDPQAAERLIAADRAAGRRPFLLVGTAGTTNTGTIDPLGPLAEVARRQRVWFHVDAAYGGGFQLTERGRSKLSGIERADSITLDVHKSMFFPYSSGLLLMRRAGALRAAHRADADYLQDMDRDTWLPDYQDLGIEMSREFRGLRLWLPLHLHGIGAFRAAIDEKLDLAAAAHRELRSIPGLTVAEPDLTVLTFRAPGGDEVNQRLLGHINASRRAYLTSTRIRGRHTLRMCVLGHRTHRTHVEEALKIIRAAVGAAARV